MTNVLKTCRSKKHGLPSNYFSTMVRMHGRSRQNALLVKSLFGCKIQNFRSNEKQRPKQKILGWKIGSTKSFIQVNNGQTLELVLDIFFNKISLLSGKYGDIVILSLCIKSIYLQKRVYIDIEKDENTYTEIVLSLRFRVYTICAKRIRLSEELYGAKSSCVIFSFQKYTLLCSLVSIAMTRKNRPAWPA